MRNIIDMFRNYKLYRNCYQGLVMMLDGLEVRREHFRMESERTNIHESRVEDAKTRVTEIDYFKKYIQRVLNGELHW